MFVVEFSGGIKAASLSLTGDSLDMLGDTLVYGCSLYVIQKGKRAAGAIGNAPRQYYVSLSDRCICQSDLSIIGSNRPHSRFMGKIGILAILANLICFLLLISHRNDNINISSVWLCSRNDIIANTSVLLTAGLVFLTGLKQKLSPNKTTTRFVSCKYVLILVEPFYKTERHSCTK